MNTETAPDTAPVPAAPSGAPTDSTAAPATSEPAAEPALYAPVAPEEAEEASDPCPDFLAHIPEDFFDF